MVGGSSAVNTCIALRSHAHDYDEWDARGLRGWSFDACLPAFKRLETDLDRDDPWHGKHGPLPIRRHPKEELAPIHARFLDACAELGFPPCPDHNAPHATGYGPHPMNKIAGRRVSAPPPTSRPPCGTPEPHPARRHHRAPRALRGA